MLTDIDLMAVEFIFYNMREADKLEIFAMMAHDNAYQGAWDAYHLIRNKGRGRISWVKGKPAGLAAFTEVWPGRWQVWMCGTEEFKTAAIPLLRWFRKEAAEILSVLHARRLDCDSMVGHDDAHAMIRAMGGIPDGPPMRKFGKGGEDFQRFVWISGENDQVIRPGYVRAA